jgi:macrolide transport system ATP-binding/permease protein
MDFIRTLLSRCAALFHKKALDEDLDEELRSHIDLAVEENMQRGMSPQQARTAALREFGGVTQTKENFRMQRGLPFLEVLSQDVRYALRQLRAAPGFTATAIITLALGIGANTAIFTLVQGILLRSLPVADPARLYRIGDKTDCCYYGGFQNPDGDFDIFPYDLYLHLKQSAPEFEQLAAVQSGRSTYSVRVGAAPAKPLHGEYVSGNFFATLGVGAYAGRPLGEADDQPGAAPAMVLSYRSWQADFAGNPAIVGSTVYVQTHPFTVAGIAPPGFFGDRITDRPPAFWMPFAGQPVLEGAAGSLLHGVDTAWIYPIGRVHPVTNIAALQTKLSIALRQWLVTRPAYQDHGGSAEVPKQHVILAPGGGGIQSLQKQTGTGLRMLMILSSVVLLIACANIANLLLARSTARRSNVAVRVALGATRRRLIRQTLTECVLLSSIGGAVGVAVAYAGSRTILAVAFPGAVNLPVQAGPSLPVLVFAFLVSLLTGVLFGLAPSWLSSHAQPAEALRGVNRTSSDRSSLPQKSLVVFQVALSVVLLAGAVLFTRSLANLERQNVGVATTNRYVLEFDPRGAGYTLDRLPALYRQIQDNFSALPGMAHVGLAMYSPLAGNNWGSCPILQGHPVPGPNDQCFSSWDRVSTHFLDSINVPIVRGRGFTDQDTSATQPVVLVNQTFAKRFFPGQDPIGKHFGTDAPQYSGAFEIVGVFADFKLSDPRDDFAPVFLRPAAQQFGGYKEPEMIASEINSMFVGAMILNFTGPQENAEALVRKTLAVIDPNLTVFYFSSMDSLLAGNFNQDRLIARLTSLFGVLALILASVGLYGVVSFFVARRTSEIGVRMAMGAPRSSVVAMVLGGALWQVLIGLALGIPAALFAGHFMKGLLFGVSSYDPLAYLGATLALGLCAAVAGFIPARHAASIDPMQALRTD